MSKNLKQMLRITGPALAALILIVVVASGCKKETNCPDGYDYTIKNTPPKAALAKSDHCEDERIAYNTAVEDSTKNADILRAAVHPALYEPDDISGIYWNAFNSGYVPQGTLLDSAERHILVVNDWLSLLDPFPYNDSTLKLLLKYSIYYVDTCYYTDSVRLALEKCENDVGIDEWIWVSDECGGYWTTSKSGKAAPAWTSANTRQRQH